MNSFKMLNQLKRQLHSQSSLRFSRPSEQERERERERGGGGGGGGGLPPPPGVPPPPGKQLLRREGLRRAGATSENFKNTPKRY